MKKLLTICLPTYNRANVLSESLEHIVSQITDENKTKVEILVSDNCSTDNTPEVVKSFIERGIPIAYNRNSENLGSDGNFLYCINNAKGKYIWLLGDDDYLLEGTLDYLLSFMSEDYGLIHIKETNRKKIKYKEYKTGDIAFYKDISHMLTFMSINIINSSTIKGVESPTQYNKTWFLQVPFYINAGCSALLGKNIILYRKILDCGHASSSNGGYNYFTVIVKNYLNIWRKACEYGWISYHSFNELKRKYFNTFVINKIDFYLIRKKMDANYDLSNSWNIIKEEFGGKLYFYTGFVFYYVKTLAKLIVRSFIK